MTEERRDPFPDLWLATDDEFLITLTSPNGPILQSTLPALARMARFGSDAVNAPPEGEVLRFTALSSGHYCEPCDPQCLCATEPKPQNRSFRILIQESKDGGQTWE